MLKLKKVSKSIGGTLIIDRVTASFPVGRISALIGPNGAGKTSLFHLITGAMPPDRGRITYRGRDLTGQPAHKVARLGVGRLFQDVRIFDNLSVLENVMIACYDKTEETPWYPFLRPRLLATRKKAVRKRAEELVKEADLADKMNRLAGELSFGQQKLLAIARLMAADCSLLLLDEPTAGLNQVMIRQVLAAIRKITEQDDTRTVIMVEHNMSVVEEIAEWVFFMNEGAIAFTGRTDHVLGCGEVRETYLGLSGDER